MDEWLTIRPPPIELLAYLVPIRHTLHFFSLSCPDKEIEWEWSVDKRQMLETSMQQRLVYKLRQEAYENRSCPLLTSELDSVVSSLQLNNRLTSRERLAWLKENRPTETVQIAIATDSLLLCDPERYQGATVMSERIRSKTRASTQYESWLIARRMRTAFQESDNNTDALGNYITILSMLFAFNAAIINVAQPMYRTSLAKPSQLKRWQKPDLNQLFTNYQDMVVHFSNSLILGFQEFAAP